MEKITRFVQAKSEKKIRLEKLLEMNQILEEVALEVMKMIDLETPPASERGYSDDLHVDNRVSE